MINSIWLKTQRESLEIALNLMITINIFGHIFHILYILLFMFMHMPLGIVWSIHCIQNMRKEFQTFTINM